MVVRVPYGMLWWKSNQIERWPMGEETDKAFRGRRVSGRLYVRSHRKERMYASYLSKFLRFCVSLDIGSNESSWRLAHLSFRNRWTRIFQNFVKFFLPVTILKMVSMESSKAHSSVRSRFKIDVIPFTHAEKTLISNTHFPTNTAKVCLDFHSTFLVVEHKRK